MDRMLQGLDGVVPYFDYILVSSASKEAQNVTPIKVFERLRDCNLRAQIETCSFFQTELKFLVIFIDQDGLRPDPEKTSAIAAMPAPTNTSDVRSFLGSVAFYIKFVESMSTIREPLDRRKVPMVSRVSTCL